MAIPTSSHPNKFNQGSALWSSLGLSDTSLTTDNSLPHIDVTSLSEQIRTETPEDPRAAWKAAVNTSLDAYANEDHNLTLLLQFQRLELPKLAAAEESLLELADRLQTAETAAIDLQRNADECARSLQAGEETRNYVAAFVDRLVLDPYLIRHVVDGKVREKEYADCLGELSKKAALYDMHDMKESAAYVELSKYLDELITTAVTKVSNFIMEKIALLKRPNTNVKIVKENVLLKHRPLVEFVELHAPNVFQEIKTSYVDTMSRTYFLLFKKYLAGLLVMKQQLPSEYADTLVGSLSDHGSSSQTLSSMFGNSGNASQSVGRGGTGRAGGAGVGQFALRSRLDVLKDVEGPAIVLATALDNNEKFYYEQIHRSLGKMLSETCASEHYFCEHFFGESDGRMFNSFFTKIIGFILDAVAAHTAPTRDTLGVLLALKVNEAHRSSMQMQKIFDLSDFFIQVDILLKPKFKKLFDENIASMAEASKTISKSARRGIGDTSPHIVTRRYAEFSASLLAIARFGTPDDSILEGLRRLRSEYAGFLNAMSTLFARPKLRYMFLINNIDLVLSVSHEHSVSGTEEYKFFTELQEIHTTAYVEHEVADHFPDIVSFVRQYERTAKVLHTPGAARRPFPSEERVKAVLRQYASNWRLGTQHMQENALREFPNYNVSASLIRSLFAKLFAYHKRCEAAVEAEYSHLKAELVTSTEISYELRQRSQQFSS